MDSGKNKVLFYTSDHLLVGAPIGYYRQTTKSPPRVSLSLSRSRLHLNLNFHLLSLLFYFTAATLLVVFVVATRLGWFHLIHHPYLSKGTSSLSPLFPSIYCIVP